MRSPLLQWLGRACLTYHFVSILPTDNLPIVTVSGTVQEILVPENSDLILLFTCDGTGEPSSNLTWVRGSNSVMDELSSNYSGISLSNDSLTLSLIINVSEADSNTLASKDGVPYYCLARNNLGTARSREVTLRYPCEQNKR